jgi:hypothetical protein
MCWSRYEERWELREAQRLEEEIRRLTLEAQERPTERTAPEPEAAEEPEQELVEA